MKKTMPAVDQNVKVEEFHYPLLKWYGSGSDISMMDELNRPDRELEELKQEARGYNFLMGKTPQILPDYREEEED